MRDIKFNCPRCGQHITIDEAGRGYQVDCPNCQSGITVPEAAGQISKSASRPRWLAAVILLIVALTVVGVLWRNRLPKSKTNESTARNQAAKSEKAALQIPVRVEQDGVYLTQDSVLNLGDSPYKKDQDGGKFLYAYEVTITAIGATNVSCTIRPNEESARDREPTDGFGNSFERKVVKLLSAAVALKPAMGLQTGDRMIICGGEKGTSLGGEVITDEMKKNTQIMPPQKFDLVDAQGKPVLREFPTANPNPN
jgi:DNA-directed RNA polymerase subunit RPC12/RpoP